MIAITVTLPLANTPYNLLTLARGVVAGFVDIGKPMTVRAGDSNDTTAANYVMIGDSSLSTSNLSAALSPGESKDVHALRNLWAMSATTNQTVNISVER